MSDSDKDFVGSIPENYDRYLVPLIFEEFAEDLANRVSGLRPTNVLETAAGSGVVARALTPKLSKSASYVVSDLNQPMLDHAQSMQAVDDRLSWQQADALDLSYADGAFDVVVCQFGVMFYPDQVQSYREARRVLKDDGALVFNVWDQVSTNEFADVVTAAVATVFPADPPGFLPRTAHGYFDTELIRQELGQAGFSTINIETLEKVSAASSHRHPAIAYCQGTPLRNEIEARDASKLEHATDVASAAIAQRWGEGPVSAKIRGHVIVARP